MTYMTVARRAAYHESLALRAYARAGITPPPCAPVNHWDEWKRSTHCNTTTRRPAA